MNEPLIAASMSASGRMMFGDFPPSSRVTRLSARPALAPISRPTSVEPVNAILSTPGWSTSAAPVPPSPVTTLTTPSGTPASSASSASRRALSGVCSAGLSTTVQPADPHRLQARVAQGVGRGDRDYTALDLGGPPGEVAKVRHRLADVHQLGHGHRL